MRVLFKVWNVDKAKPVSQPMRRHHALAFADAFELKTREHHTVVPA